MMRKNHLKMFKKMKKIKKRKRMIKRRMEKR
jgi:hypothetical protein